MAERLSTPAGRANLPARAALAGWLAVGGALAITMAMAGLLAVQPELPGRPDADNLTGALSLFGQVTARLAGGATLGLIAGIVAFLPFTADGELPDGAATLARWTVRAAQLWWPAALFMTFANPTFITGVPIRSAFRLDAWWTFLAATPSSLAWFVSAAVALGTVVVGYRARRPGAFILAWLAGAGATLLVAVTGNVTVGLDHDWATDAMVPASLATTVLTSGAVGVVAVAAVRPTSGTAGVRRYQRAAGPLLVLAAAGFGAVAWQQLAGVPPLQTAFGIPVVAGFAVLVLLSASWGWRQAAGASRSQPTTVVRDLVLLVLGTAWVAAAEHLAPPRFHIEQTIQINYLGYEVDLPATIERLAGLGRPNLLWVMLAVGAVGLYVWGVVRVHRRSGRWPVSRLLCWLAGWGLTLYLAVSGLWMYSTAVFSWHMLVHMTVNMMVPLLCVLGAPFGLVHAASRKREPGELPGPRELLNQLGDNPVVRVLLSPPVIWAVYIFSLFLVYFSPLFPWLMRYHWGHQLMLVHFMLTGFAFFSLLVGPERHSRQLPHLVRFALLLSVMPFHAIFAVGIMMARSVIGEQFYRSIDVAWVGDLLADQNTAGQITWFTGEIPAFIAVVVLAAQWFRSDTSEETMADDPLEVGQSEDELAAYNEMLAQLAQRDRLHRG